MKKLLIFLLTSLFLTTNYLLLVTSPAQAAAASLSLSPSVGIINKGCPFTLDIDINTGGASTAGTDVILFYDSTRFRADQIINGTVYSDYPGNSIDAQNGRITVSGLAPAASPFSGSGILASIDFTVLTDASIGAAQIRFDFDPQDKGKTTDSNVVEALTVADVLSQVTDGSFTIGEGTDCAFGETTIPIITKTTPQGTPEEIITPIPKKLPDSADITPTMIFTISGGLLVILGLFGLAFLK